MANAFYDKQKELLKDWNPKNHEVVDPHEVFWVEQQRWLESRGYLLRPRYSPDWVPSWKGTKKSWYSCEDGKEMPAYRSHLIDATRMSDGMLVGIKRIFKSQHPFEVEIGHFFSTAPLDNDPRNHCVPILETLEVPDYEGMLLIVMPFLRPYNSPRFMTVGEAVEYFRQVLEGLQFMHEHRVAHRDCSGHNIMMDARGLFPKGYHPMRIWRKPNGIGTAKHVTRSECPPKYYLLDFGLSRRYDIDAERPLEYPIRGGDRSVPEFQGQLYNELRDPFATDIYYIGNMIKEDFIERSSSFGFMVPLVNNMVQNDPAARPTIDQVVYRFDRIYRSLSTFQLRSRIARRKEPMIIRHTLDFFFLFRRVQFALLGTPAIPKITRARRRFSTLTPWCTASDTHDIQSDITASFQRQ